MKKIALAVLLLTGWAGTALASSYDELNAGIQLYNLEQWKDAITAFDKALTANDLAPSLQFIAHYDRGQAHLHLAQFDQAIADYSAGLTLRPGEADVLIGRALAYGSTRKLDLAGQDIDKVIAARPALGAAYDIRVILRLRSGQIDKARDDMRTLLKLPPANSASRLKIGIVKWETGQISDAEDDFSHEASHGPNNIYAWLWYALTQARQGKNVPRRALPDYDLAKWPGPIVNFFLGSAEMDTVFVAAAQGEAQATVGQVCEANFYVGEWLLWKHDPDGAKPLISKAANVCPGAFVEWMPAQMDLAGLP